MSTQQKAAVLLPALLSTEDFQLHRLSSTGNQPFREEEGIPWKCCTAGTLFQVPSIFHNCMELVFQLTCDESHNSLVCHLQLYI